ncbi:MAG: OmpH family outer membrane protein [Acidobacteriota bacterium]
MLKRITLAFMIVAACAYGASAQAVTGKTGVVDAEVVIRGSVEGKKLLEKLNKFQASKQSEIDAVTKEVNDLRNKLQTQSLTLNDEARMKMEKEVEQKATNLRRLQEDAQAELDDMKEEGLRQVNLKVLPLIEKFARENGYALVFDKNRSGIIVSDESLDVSDEIIRLLDQETKPEAATPPQPK